MKLYYLARKGYKNQDEIIGSLYKQSDEGRNPVTFSLSSNSCDLVESQILFTSKKEADYVAKVLNGSANKGWKVKEVKL